MPQVFNITDEEIRFAEQILLPEGKEFDPDAKEFIKNLDTIDLQAVPGSGKTTVLLAKLILLERRLPFSDGSGILVLSHTNAAIDEIKQKIQKHCPKLFSYPNYIGTIQSFVDEFLAIPFYVSIYKRKPIRIDDELYDEVASRRFKNLPDSKAKVWLMQKHEPENVFCKLRFDVNRNLTDGINGKILLKSATESATYKAFKTIKFQIIKSGILHFDDAYFLAENYIEKVPAIIEILRKRFPFVFVDEMQDMDTHQYNLLERIFNNSGKCKSIFQRIGDKNQAIYNSVKATDVWVDRETVLRLKGSKRLSKPIADVVKKFALYNDADFDIVGQNASTIKPHILLYDDSNITEVIPCFSNLVMQLGLAKSGKVKVICWNTDWKEEEDSRQDISKLRLEDFHKGYRKEKSKPKEDYDYLKTYLSCHAINKNSLGPIRKGILNALLKVLRLENIQTSEGRPYTKKKLVAYIREKDEIAYEKLSFCLYHWSMEIVRGNMDDVWDEIKCYMPTFFAVFSTNQLSKSLDFINVIGTQSTIDGELSLNKLDNIYKEGELEVEITSVHAVKGHTHCATLYLESYFYKDGKGVNAKSYESQRLADQFLGKNIDASKAGERIKQSAKMAYVGFSRPTSLLCVAIHKDRFDKYLKSISESDWEIKCINSIIQKG